ncbi:hypothetical protein TWF694_004819 [Orbilia ellipsospora]|uniref:H/ACA ribonucleoprotein complex non-core subunit NAF1 n=1 Tax=Orbilia ellipsospora TaxID=2528407 RepID=A0AAV9WWB9_9PEZI
MDSDPILYGDGPDPQATDSDFGQIQPQPKRARLSFDSQNSGEAINGLTASTLGPSRQTPIDTEPESLSIKDGPVEPADDNAIPGLFLAIDRHTKAASEKSESDTRMNEEIPDEDMDDGEIQEPVSREREQKESEEDGLADNTEPLEQIDVPIEDELGAYQELTNEAHSDQLHDEDGDEDEDGRHGVIRDMDDFLEKGKANLGNPNAEWQLDSSADEAEDDIKNESRTTSSPGSSAANDNSDSSDSDGSDDEESTVGNGDDGEEDAVFLDIQKEAKRLMDEDGGSDDDGANGFKKGTSGPYRTKNELPETRSARPNIDISASTPIVFLGAIDSVVDDLILVKASVSGEYQVLNEQSLLCFEDRSLLGPVQETFGRVEQPYYTVRLRDADEVKSLNATLGRKVHYIPSHSTFLFTKTIRALKGSDASNLHDEEVGDDEREFSDDEAEAEFKRRQKEEKKAKGQNRVQAQPSDTMDEPYVPLSRPANLHEMSAPPPNQINGPQRRDAPPRMPARDHQLNRGGFRGRGRGRGSRQAPGRMDMKPSPRRPNQNIDHHHHQHHQHQHQHHNHQHQHRANTTRDERQPAPALEARPTSNKTVDTVSNSNQSVQVPAPPQDFSALLPFLAPGQVLAPTFPSGAHINPAFFPIPSNSQLPFPGQFGQFPPPPLPLNPSHFPMLPQQQQQQPPPPPSVEEILNILRSQGHNL